MVRRPVGGSLRRFYLATNDWSDRFLYQPDGFRAGDEPDQRLVLDIPRDLRPSVETWHVPDLPEADGERA